MRDLTPTGFLDEALSGAGRNGFLPGAKEALMEQFADRDDDAEDLFAAVVDHVLTPEGRLAFFHAGNESETAQARLLQDIARRLPDDGPKSLGGSPPLRIAPSAVLKEVLGWMPLKAGSRDALFSEWAMAVAGMTPGRVAKFVATKLRSREYDAHLVRQPAMDSVERRVHEALEHLRDQLKPGLDTEALARRWRDIGANSTKVSEAAEILQGRLNMEDYAHLRRHETVEVKLGAIKEAQAQSPTVQANIKAMLNSGRYGGGF